MSKLERYFDKLMDEYYLVLINSYSDSVKDSARYAIKELSKLGKDERADESFLKDLEQVIIEKMGNDFATSLEPKVKVFAEKAYKLSSQEPQFRNVQIAFGPIDSVNISNIKNEQIFWLKNHYEESDKLHKTLHTAMENNLSNKELASELKTHFGETLKQGDVYFKGLAEHTSLRVREFGRLSNYLRFGAVEYEIVAVLDDRTSDICRALHGKRFSVSSAINVMNEMFEICGEGYSPEETKQRLKDKAPFVRDNQVLYDEKGEPFAIEGNMSPFPPFHWRCRTQTVMVYD